MRLSIQVLLTSALAVSALGYSLDRRSTTYTDLPDCAASCVTDSFGDCSSLDVACICKLKSFISQISCCVLKACSTANVEKTLTFAHQLCDSVGVSTLPTAATCASTATDTATSAASGTAAATATTTGAASAATTADSSATTGASSAETATSAAAASASTSSSSSGAAPHNIVSGMGAGAAAIAALMIL
ncbi:MAG: hypothetical protein M1834_006544 [Cirrosporium novae-zelandiae]|nr:MAG: hypothetical protein M1834_006544 [Cirrosporium novae-zelandiae]